MKITAPRGESPRRVRLGFTRPDPATFVPLVISIARRLLGSCPGSLGDLIGYGAIGLMDAARLFDPRRGNKFSTFACHRIRGAILDGVRREEWAGRYALQRLRAIGESPKRLLTGALDPLETRACQSRPFAAIEVADELQAVLSRLPPRERLILRLYHLEELKFEEIGELLGISESRACQLHTRAMRRLRRRCVA